MSFSEFDKSMQKVMQNDLELPTELSWEKMSIPNPHENKKKTGFVWFSWLAIGLVIAGGIIGQFEPSVHLGELNLDKLDRTESASNGLLEIQSKKENHIDYANSKQKDADLIQTEQVKETHQESSISAASDYSTLSVTGLETETSYLDESIRMMEKLSPLMTTKNTELLPLKKPFVMALNVPIIEQFKLNEGLSTKKVRKYEMSFMLGSHISKSNYSGDSVSFIEKINGSERVSPSFSASLNVQRLLTKNIGIGIGFSHRVDHTVFKGEESLTPEFFYENGVLIRRTRTQKTISHNYKQITSLDLMVNYRVFLGQRLSLEIAPVTQIGLITGFRGKYYGAYGGIAVVEKDGAKEFADRVLFNVGCRLGASYQLTNNLRVGTGINVLNQLKKSETQINGIDSKAINVGGQVFITRSL